MPSSCAKACYSQSQNLCAIPVFHSCIVKFSPRITILLVWGNRAKVFGIVDEIEDEIPIVQRFCSPALMESLSALIKLGIRHTWVYGDSVYAYGVDVTEPWVTAVLDTPAVGYSNATVSRVEIWKLEKQLAN